MFILFLLPREGCVCNLLTINTVLVLKVLEILPNVFHNAKKKVNKYICQLRSRRNSTWFWFFVYFVFILFSLFFFFFS